MSAAVTVVEARDRSVTFVTPVQHRAVDLQRVGLPINAVGPERLEEALARPGCVVVDALKHEAWILPGPAGRTAGTGRATSLVCSSPRV